MTVVATGGGLERGRAAQGSAPVSPGGILSSKSSTRENFSWALWEEVPNNALSGMDIFTIFKFHPVWKGFFPFTSDSGYSLSITDLYPDTRSYIFMMSISITILSGKN